MEKIIQVLLSLLEEQEKAEIKYKIEELTASSEEEEKEEDF